MLKTTAMLIEELREYANPAARIRRMVDAGQLTPVIKGLYEIDASTPGHYLAGAIYGPSYLSFEFALAEYGLIPEAVYSFTSATCGKGRKKRYDTPFGVYLYRDVPVKAFPYGVRLIVENGYSFMIATPEKALCDILYTLPPCANQSTLKSLLFEDLRIDKQTFDRLNKADLSELAGLYDTKNHKLLISMIRRMAKNEQHH